MVRFYCDRCGNEIKRQDAFIIQSKLGNTEDKQVKHLCTGCRKLFMLFLSGKKIDPIQVVRSSEVSGCDSNEHAAYIEEIAEHASLENNEQGTNQNKLTDRVSENEAITKNESSSSPEDCVVENGQDTVSSDWVIPIKVRHKLDMFMGNKITVSEYIDVAGKSKIDPQYKTCMVNLWLNGIQINEIASMLSTTYTTVSQVINIFKRKARAIEVRPQVEVDIRNLLKVKWKIQDIASDQSIPVRQVIAIYVRNMGG